MAGQIPSAVTDHINLTYQPVADLATGRALAAEAIAGWRHPELGDLPPTDSSPRGRPRRERDPLARERPYPEHPFGSRAGEVESLLGKAFVADPDQFAYIDFTALGRASHER